MASTQPKTGSESSRVAHKLCAAALVLAALWPAAATASAATETTSGEPTSGYSQTTPAFEQPPPPKAPTSRTLPKAGEKPYYETSPSKELPEHERDVPRENTGKASALPFTGFNLRWELGLGLVALGTGVWIATASRRRQRRR
jgi:hypothetical protein